MIHKKRYIIFFSLILCALLLGSLIKGSLRTKPWFVLNHQNKNKIEKETSLFLSSEDSTDRLIRSNRSNRLSLGSQKNTDENSRQKPSTLDSWQKRLLDPEYVIEYLQSSSSPIAVTLSKFFSYQQNQLRTANEEKEYYNMLSDRELLHKVGDYLMHSNEESLDYGNESLRSIAVAFINEAMSYSSNPVREDVRTVSETVILASNILGTMPRPLKISLAGDKVELSIHYLQHFPQNQTSLLTRSNGINREIIKRAVNYVGIN